MLAVAFITRTAVTSELDDLDWLVSVSCPMLLQHTLSALQAELLKLSSA